MFNTPLIIYHANCYDGFTSAWICNDHFCFESWAENDHEVPPEIVAGLYGQAPPDVTGREVYMVDFSYKRPVLEEMAKKAKSITILDHHKTAEADLKDLNLPNVKVHFDMYRSGAMLTWHYFNSPEGEHDDAAAPPLVQYVQDRDLFKFALKDSEAINASIMSYAFTFESWHLLHERMTLDLTSVVHEGESLLRAKNQYVEFMKAFVYRVKLPEIFGKFAGMEVPVVNAPYINISDLLSALLSESDPVAIGWFKRADGKFQHSLRSTDAFDCSEISKVFGGGGHKKASGFEALTLLL